MNASRRHDQPQSDRREAATLLCRARQASADSGCSHERRAEAIEWAVLALPRSLAALRLKIDLLLRDGDHDHADALLAQTLLLRPDEPSLLLRRARRLLDDDQIEPAKAVIEGVLRRRPDHGATLRAAGLITAAAGEHARAISLLERAYCRVDASLRARIGSELIHVLLQGRQIDRAEEIAFTVDERGGVLLALVRQAQGRWLDAAELLERAAEQEADARGRDAALCQLIDVLECSGEVARLDSFISDLGPERPEPLGRAGLVWLARGAFDTALARVAPLADVPGAARLALPVIIAAAAMTHRPQTAERALRRWQSLTAGQNSARDQKAMAEAWSRSVRGRIIAEQRSAISAGADPSFSQLQPLLRRAARVFNDQLIATAGRGGSEAEILDLRRHRAACLAAMGRSEAA